MALRVLTHRYLDLCSPRQNWPFHTRLESLHFGTGFLPRWGGAENKAQSSVSRLGKCELLHLLYRTWGYVPHCKGEQAIFLSQPPWGATLPVPTLQIRHREMLVRGAV